MFSHILIPTNGSQLCEDAARQAIQLARSLEAHITVVTASPPYRLFGGDDVVLSGTEDSYNEEREIRAARDLAVVSKAAEAAGVPCDALHVFHEKPYAAIIEVAERRGCDVICMASHGRRALTALVVGSETMKVLAHSRVPVIVFR